MALAQAYNAMIPEGLTPAQVALRWILDFDAVTVVIPGAKSPEQVAENCSAASLPKPSDSLHNSLRELYRDQVSPHIRGKY